MPPGPGAGAPEKVIVCFGDTTAEDPPADERQRWPSRLHARLSAAGTGSYRVINAEAPGLTTGGALGRSEPGGVFPRPRLVTQRVGSSGSGSGGRASAPQVARCAGERRARE